MSNKPDLLSRYDDEWQRAQEQSQMLHLQNQIDELRRQLKETNNKYSWAMEQLRKNEALIGQIQGIVEKSTQENQYTLEGYRRELTALRKEVANALLKIEEGVRPMTDIQTQLHHLGEQRKRDQSQVPGWLQRIDALETRSQEQEVKQRETEERHRQLVGQLDRFRDVDEETKLEIQRVYEELQIEKQAMRRQSVELQQLVTDSQAQVGELISRVGRAEELASHTKQLVEQLPPQIALIEQQIPELIIEIKRIERLSTDRFLMNQERMEELRGQQDEKIADIRVTEDEHTKRLEVWLERVEEWCREYETRLTRTQTKLESIRQQHLERLQEIEVRERRLVDTLFGAVRQVQEQNRVEQLAAERDGEG